MAGGGAEPFAQGDDNASQVKREHLLETINAATGKRGQH